MLVVKSSPFGSRTRTRVLFVLALVKDSYPRELSRLLEIPLNAVQQALLGLEKDGLVAARTAGRTRLYRLNPRYFAQAELTQLLLRLTEPEAELRGRIEELRRRPRRTGKPL